jgi:hypothetical protein
MKAVEMKGAGMKAIEMKAVEMKGAGMKDAGIQIEIMIVSKGVAMKAEEVRVATDYGS